MRAIALSPSREPELVDRPDSRPAAGDVVIRPHYCGICGTDLHATEKHVYHKRTEAHDDADTSSCDGSSGLL